MTFRVRRCARCHRRRRIYPGKVFTARWGYEYQSWRCSKGHAWRAMTRSVRNVDLVLRRVWVPAIVAELNRPSRQMVYFQRA